MARFEALKARPEVPQQIFQRLCDGERLKEIARAWGCPKGLFVFWFVTEHAELYDRARMVRAQDWRDEAIEIADGATTETAAPAKIRVDTRLKLMERDDRERYGKVTKHEHTLNVNFGERLRVARERVAALENHAVQDAEIVPERVQVPDAL